MESDTGAIRKQRIYSRIERGLHTEPASKLGEIMDGWPEWHMQYRNRNSCNENIIRRGSTSYLDYRQPDPAFWLIFVVQNRDTGRQACRTFSPGRNKRKRLLRTHWLPEKNTMAILSSATAGGRRNLRRARLVSEVPSTGRPPGRRNIRRVGRSVVEEKT